MPFRAVATTANSPVLSTTSVSSRRKKGLSSTTSTVAVSEGVDTMGHRAHLDGAVGHVQAHGADVISPDRFAYQRNPVGVEDLTGRDDVALAHLDGAGGRQRGEHAGTPDQARGHPAGARA